MTMLLAAASTEAIARLPARYAYRSVAIDGTFVAYVPLTNVRYGRILNGVGPFSARLKLPPLGGSLEVTDASYSDVYSDDYTSTTSYQQGSIRAAAFVDATAPLKRIIYVERDGIVVDAYVIWQRQYDHDTQELVLRGAQLWSLIRARRIRWNATFTQQDQLAIARSLVTTAQASTGGDLDIALGAETSGVLRDRTYVANEDKPLGEAIEQLAAVEDGFDFRLDVDRSGASYTRTLRLFYPRVGRNAAATGHVWTLGANLLRLDYPEDGQRAANSIVGIGAGEGATMLRSVATDTALISEGYPLLEDGISLKDVSIQATLDGHTRAELARRRLPVVLPRATVLADRDPILTAYVPGDDGRLVVRPGRDPRWPDGLDVYARIIEITAEPPDDGRPETVTLTFQERA